MCPAIRTQQVNLIRADKLLIDRGIAGSRSEAAELIRTGGVRIDGRPVAKPATMVPRNGHVQARDDDPKWVSRGALKLDHALEMFQIDCTDIVALDCGASTGGFTECLLRRGAAVVYAVDVGYGQLHWSLRQDPRVRIFEKTNLRTVPPDLFDDAFDLATLDLSFISLKYVLEKVTALLAESGRIIALVKPQFEAGREAVGRGGVVRDPAIHRRVLLNLAAWCVEHGLDLTDTAASPVTGPKGNREFLFYLKPGSAIFSQKHDDLIQKALRNDA
jgi:23S rRNA (cytidine1920-2'-O)/16S rRNA (cytidine1409-2'-O)-methyltransferase